jgi:hypothetical protein
MNSTAGQGDFFGFQPGFFSFLKSMPDQNGRIPFLAGTAIECNDLHLFLPCFAG